jgi:hypothetical protein
VISVFFQEESCGNSDVDRHKVLGFQQGYASTWQVKLDQAMDDLVEEAIRLALYADSESVRAQMLKELIGKKIPKFRSASDTESCLEYSRDDLKNMDNDELVKVWRKVFDQCIRRKEKE